MGIVIFMLKSQRRAFRWPNDLCARLWFLKAIYEMKKYIALENAQL